MGKKQYLSLREIQLEELNLLKKTVQYFHENNIRYFLDGGTLLGAIRHKGFIPWDDDIDIGVPRPDFEKFIELIKRDNKLDVTYSELHNSPFPFAKVINKNILLENSHDVESNYLWIDIFPFDGASSNRNKFKIQRLKILFLTTMIHIKYWKIALRKKAFFKDLIKILLKPISFFINPKNLINLAIKYDFDTAEKAGNIVWGRGFPSIVEKTSFDKYIDVEFEGIKFKTIKNYDKYLSNLYGDYMKIPEEQDRVTHLFKAYKK